MSETRRTVLGAVALSLAGCLGDQPASATGTASPTATAPTATAPTTAPGTDCPPTLTVYELGVEPVDEESAVDYASLTPAQQRTFERARNGSVEDFDDAWYDISVVRYQGTDYRASVEEC